MQKAGCSCIHRQNKEVLGSQLSHEQVKGLTDDEVEKFYKRYEAYIGSKTTETLLQTIFMLASKAIGMVVKVDDVTWKLCKRTCKRTSLLTRRFRLWLEI